LVSAVVVAKEVVTLWEICVARPEIAEAPVEDIDILFPEARAALWAMEHCMVKLYQFHLLLERHGEYKTLFLAVSYKSFF
jgi:hypothetical protein